MVITITFMMIITLMVTVVGLKIIISTIRIAIVSNRRCSDNMITIVMIVTPIIMTAMILVVIIRR